MKQHAWLFLGLVVTLCQCLAAAQTNITAAAPALEMRKVQRGTLGHACRSSSSKHRCNTGLFCNNDKKKCAAIGSVGSPCKRTANCSGHANGSICYAGKCLANVNRPKLAPCSADAMCVTGYCGTRSRCASQHKQGASCVRAAQCETLNCDGATQKCGAALAPPSATAAASAALASVTPVANSKAFYDSSLSRPLLARSGQVRTVGSVKVVNTAAGPAVEMAATSAQPAMLQQVLDAVIQRRDTATNAVLSFNYLVTATTATCSIVPSINGQQLTPFIAITAAKQSGKGSYTYSGAPVSSYAVGVVCDGQGASSTVDFDNVAVTSSATTTPGAAPASTAAPGSSASAPPSTTYPPLPTGACSGLANCDMEAGTPFILNNDCRVVSTQEFPSHSGSSAIDCVVAPGFEAFLSSAPNVHTYTPGSPYTLTFWARNATGASVFSSLRCTVRGGNDGEGALAYDGVCPLTSTPADVNGYNLFALPFTATDANMQFMMHFIGRQNDDDDDYYQRFTYDDVSILDGQYDVGYVTPPATGTASSDVAVTACSGGVLHNCGFETGYSNSWTRNIDDSNSGRATACNVTSDADSVHTGKYAYKCFIDPAARMPVFGEGLSQDIDISTLTPGAVYDFSFWAKTSAADAVIRCTIGSPAAGYLGQTMTVDTSAATENGFSKYTAQFATDYDEKQTLTLTCLGMQPGTTYTFDDFGVKKTTTMLDVSAIPTHCSGLAGCSLDNPTSAQRQDPNYFASLVQWVVQNNRADYESSAPQSFCDGWIDDNPYTDTNNQRRHSRSGQRMKLCNIPAASKNRFFYVQGGQNHTYVQGQQYTWSFWVNVAQPSSVDKLKCIVWDKAGDGKRVYDGVCPITTAAQVNGYSQVALTFTAVSTDMSFFVAATDVGTYLFDEFSMLDGTFPLTYTTQPSALPSTPSTLQQCNSLHNCGWETGYMNGWRLTQRDYTDCAITSDAANVRAGGQYALACKTTKPAGYSNVGFNIASPSFSVPQLVQGTSYTYSFWAKGLGSSAVVRSGTSTFSPVGSPDTNGFQQYAVTFRADSTDGASYTGIQFTLSDATTNLFLDDFALVQAS